MGLGGGGRWVGRKEGLQQANVWFFDDDRKNGGEQVGWWRWGRLDDDDQKIDRLWWNIYEVVCLFCGPWTS